MSNLYIRPFKDLEFFESLFRCLQIRISEGSNWQSEEKLIIESDIQLSQLELQFKFALDGLDQERFEKALSDNGLNEDDIAVGLIMRNKFLKEISVKDDLFPALDSLSVLETPVCIRPEFRIPADQGLEIVVSMRLINSKQPKPGKPHLRETLLSSRTFQIIPPKSGPLDFAFLPLTKEIREDHKLPKSCVSHVISLQSFHETDNIKDSLEVYIDPDSLVVMQTEDVGEILQLQFVTEAIVSGLVHAMKEIARNDVDYSQVNEESILKQLLRSLADIKVEGREKYGAEEIFNLLKANPHSIVPFLEHKFDLKKIIDKYKAESEV